MMYWKKKGVATFAETVMDIHHTFSLSNDPRNLYRTGPLVFPVSALKICSLDQNNDPWSAVRRRDAPACHLDAAMH
jgi:hypothetical protein